ncbi:32451_t:CDS:2, partial [Racocetra persica]
HRNSQSLTSPVLNGPLKNILKTLQSLSSQLEELSNVQTNDLESFQIDQLS